MRKNLSKIYPIIAFQGGFALLLSLGFFIVAGSKAGYSALLGGMLCVLLNMLFAGIFFLGRSFRPPKDTVKRFYFAETSKFLGAILAFSCIFIYLDVNAASLFIGFVLAQVLQLFAPLLAMSPWRVKPS